MQGAEGGPSAKPSAVGAAETASDPLEPMVGGDRPFPSNFPTTHSRAYLGCLTKAESILQTKQVSMRHAFQFRHLSYADKIMKTSGAARRSMIFSRDKTQALKCIDVAEDVQAAEQAMLVLHVEDVPPPPDVQEHVPPPPDVQERRDEEDDAATPPVLQPAGRSQRPSPSRRRTRRSGPDPLLELLLTLTLEPFSDRNIFTLRNPATVHLFNDDRASKRLRSPLRWRCGSGPRGRRLGSNSHLKVFFAFGCVHVLNACRRPDVPLTANEQQRSRRFRVLARVCIRLVTDDGGSGCMAQH